MQSGSIAKRYARALLDLAREAGQVDTVLRDLEAFNQIFGESASLRSVLMTPSFSAPQRMSVLTELLNSMHLSGLSNRFLLYVAQKQRMGAFPGILREFRNYYDNLNRLVRVTVTSAVELSVNLEAQIVERVERLTGRTVVLTKVVDQGIIGGVVTRVGGLLIDGSLSTQLARLRTTLLQEQLS